MRGLCRHHVDARERHVLPQHADRVGKLRFRDRVHCLRERDARVAFTAPLERHVDAPRHFRRTAVVLRAEPGAEHVEMIRAEAEHRIRPQARGDHLRVGDAQVAALGHQRQVVLHRLLDRLRDRQRLRAGRSGARVQHEYEPPHS